MDALKAIKTQPKMTYVWNKKKIYTDAIKKLNKAEAILIVPINYVDITETPSSLVYMCTHHGGFIFDLIMLKEEQIGKELVDIVKSNKIKFVFSKFMTFYFLNIDMRQNIPNVYEIEFLSKREFGYGVCKSRIPHSTEFNIDDVDWSLRPFKSNEQFKAGTRLYELLMTNDIKLKRR
nr:uncharacterized protein LOC111414627 [Onthophagus taurus]